MTTAFKILIAYDGSDCAEAALDDLCKAGLPKCGVEALALSVAEAFMLPSSLLENSPQEDDKADADSRALDKVRYARNINAMSEAEEFARRAGERLRANFPEWTVTHEATNGSPAWEIVAKADSWRPDLVVVGSHGRSALGRMVMGSVSQRVMSEARCSVRVARGQIELEEEPVRIVIGLDGSKGSEAAVRAVKMRAWPAKSEARIVLVQDPLVPSFVGRIVPPVTKWTRDVNDEELGWLQAIADRSKQELSSNAHLETSVSMLTGEPKRALVEEAESFGADCIFVGSTGFSNRVERFLIGSVSSAVAARAHCSVEVVREKESDEKVSK